MYFYFNIDWGNIPDWIQAIGALIAAVGLVVTLILQRNTLKEQQAITRLEHKKFWDSNKPILELADIDYKREGQYRTLDFDVVVKKNFLQRLQVEDDFPDYFKVSDGRFIKDVILPQNYKFHFQISYTLAPMFIEVDEIAGGYAIRLQFEDAYSNKYIQDIIFKGAANVFLQPAYLVTGLSV